MQSLPYRELIGTLLQIANGTRPDISYTVGTLAKYTNNPAELHWKALLRVLGYLAKTLDYCIKYEGIENGKTGVEAVGYSRGILPQVSDFKCYVDALQQTWTRDEVQHVMCLRLQVVQCHGRVVCRHQQHYQVWSLNIWQLVQQLKKLSG